MSDDSKLEPVLVLHEKTRWSTGDNAEFTFRDGHLNITVEEPWAGCTETGFGQTTSIGVDLEGAKALYQWLGAHIKEAGAYREDGDAG